MNNAEINQQAEKLMNVSNIQEANFYVNEVNSNSKNGSSKGKKKHNHNNNRRHKRRYFKHHNGIFANYVQNSTDYCSMKKTLFYAEQPHSFYELYVCNNLAYYKSQVPDSQISKTDKNGKFGKIKEIINNATPEILARESEYIIITGTGGIGKSMFLVHMFLSTVKGYDKNNKLPILLSLKDYKEERQDIVDFIWDAVRKFAPKILKQDIIYELERKRVSLMLDGLDELQSTLREKFNAELENFIKAYPGNGILMTSRPTSSLGAFISFTRFSVFKIEPLTKKQALTLIKKLSYWNEETKENFLKELDEHLYEDHKEFASNPLLLTIMLRAYTYFGEVPAKIHVFYSKAYETMAREHDATKGSYKRPFHTKLTPEELKKLFSAFCALTYGEEKVEFTDNEFISYMNKVIKKLEETDVQMKDVVPQEILLDVTDNLCIMYREGGKYHFIHGTFQEYFTAYYIAHYYDDKDLAELGMFFEDKNEDIQFKFDDSDKTFDMVVDMIPERVERHIFLPYLEKLLSDCEKLGELDGYWEFLSKQYPSVNYHDVKSPFPFLDENKASSFLYRSIVTWKNLKSERNINDLIWPKQIFENNNFMRFRIVRVSNADFEKEFNSNKTSLNVSNFINAEKINDEKGKKILSSSISIYVDTIRRDPAKYSEIKSFMEKPEFPLMEEYNNVKRYYSELQERRQRRQKKQQTHRIFKI